MFVVLFEVEPKAERWDEYLAIAKALRPVLEQIDGFIDNERFRSRRSAGRLLSLSTWRDEKALVRWRTQATHHGAQEKGRFAVFADYRLRVGEVAGDTHVPSGTALAVHRLDETAVGAAKAMTISEPAPGTAAGEDLAAGLGLPPPGTRGLVACESFAGIAVDGRPLLLASWVDAAAAGAWQPPPLAGLRHRQVRVVRDYGMHDRREAPQYYPDVPAGGTGQQGEAPARSGGP